MPEVQGITFTFGKAELKIAFAKICTSVTSKTSLQPLQPLHPNRTKLTMVPKSLISCIYHLTARNQLYNFSFPHFEPCGIRSVSRQIMDIIGSYLHIPLSPEANSLHLIPTQYNLFCMGVLTVSGSGTHAFGLSRLVFEIFVSINDSSANHALGEGRAIFCPEGISVTHQRKQFAHLITSCFYSL